VRRKTPLDASGLTLVEALCVLAIVGLIMGAVLSTLEATVSGFQRARATLRDARLAQGIATLFRADLAEAVSIRSAEISALRGGGTGGVMLAFFTKHSAFPLGRPSGSGVFRVEYIMEESEERPGVFSLFRRESPHIPGREPASGTTAEGERVADGLAAIRLRFFDGTQWYDSWQRMTMPYMIRMDFGLAGDEAEPRGETTAYFTPVASADVDATPLTPGR